MTSRLDRKKQEISYKSSGGMNDLFDNQIKSAWRINDQQYNFLCEFGTDEEIEHMVSNLETFELKRKALNAINELIDKYEKTKQ